MTRRGLLQAGAALAASPAVLANAKHNIGERYVPLSAAVIDVRSCDGRAFGRAAAANGLLVHGIRADLAEVYCGQLAPYWREHGPSALGGLTTAPALFYLERLAWDADLRVVFLGRHGIADPARHSLSGPPAVVELFRDSVRVLDWRIALASVVTRVPVPTLPLSPNAVRDAVVAGDDALFSWVLAPVRRYSGAPRRVFV